MHMVTIASIISFILNGLENTLLGFQGYFQIGSSNNTFYSNIFNNDSNSCTTMCQLSSKVLWDSLSGVGVRAIQSLD